MNRTWALRPGAYAEGPRVVSTILRPVRPAVLIPEDAPDLAARFAESRSLAWGGHACFALPFSRSEGLREPWRRLLDLLDPDLVYALGISRPRGSSGVVNMNAPQRKPPRPLVDRMQDGLGRMLYTAQGPERLFTQSSALMHSVLDAVGENLKPPDAERFVVVPKVRGRYPSRSYLPVVARYGGVDDAEVQRHLNRVHSHRYEFDIDLSESVRVEEVGAADDLLSVLAGDLGGLLEAAEAEHALTLPELTLQGLQVECRGVAYWEAPGEAEGDPERGRYGPIVVTGEDESVEDFALFWTLRAEHYFAAPFPLWIPIDLLGDEGAPAAVEKALGRVRPSVMEPAPRKDDLRIVSASMGSDELRERLAGLYPEARIGADDPTELFTATCELYFAKEKLPAHFDRGRASVQPPRPEELKRNLIPGVDCVAYEVGVDRLWLPQGEAMGRHVGWLESRDNVSKRGNLRFVKQFNKHFSEADLIDLRTPDGWTLLRSVFKERGYDVAPTAKAASALGQLELIGGVGNLDVLASSMVRALLRVLSRRRGEKRPFVAERKTLKYEHFRARWGRDAARDVLRWLVDRRVVFRGAVLECSRCRLSGWYAVDRVSEVWRCDGCQEDLPVPLEPDKTEWHYRINELYAHGHNQGTLTPLLTLNAMVGAWGGRPTGGGLGFYPGVELKAKKGARVPFPKKEIDLVALSGGELVLAECKESTEHLASSEKADEFARQLADTVALADHLGASRLLVASSTTFPVKAEVLLREVTAGHSVELTWLDGRDLLDPSYFANPLAFRGAGGRAGKPEGRDEEYLELLRKGLSGADG